MTRPLTGVALIALLSAAAPVGAQIPAAEPTEPEGRLEPITVSPRGAFLRAVALPGWGHTAIGSHTRGGFYFAAQTANVYMFLRTRRRLSEARDRLAFRESSLRTQLADQGVVDFDEVEAALGADSRVAELRRLEESRGDQQEDIVALGIFILFLSGADAYVSAHLARFPDPLEIQAEPVGDGRYALGLRVSLPF